MAMTSEETRTLETAQRIIAGARAGGFQAAKKLTARQRQARARNASVVATARRAACTHKGIQRYVRRCTSDTCGVDGAGKRTNRCVCPLRPHQKQKVVVSRAEPALPGEQQYCLYCSRRV